MTDDNAENRETTRFRVRHIFYFALLLLLFLALLSYSQSDAALILGGRTGVPANWIGRMGAVFAFWVFNLFGLAGYALMALMLFKGTRLFLEGRGGGFFALASGTLLTLLGLVLVLAIAPEQFVRLTAPLGLGSLRDPSLALPGGVVGQVLAAPATGELADGFLRQLIGTVGTMIAGWVMFTAGLLVLYFADWHNYLRDRVFGFAGQEEEEPEPRSRLAEVAALPEAKEPLETNETKQPSFIERWLRRNQTDPGDETDNLPANRFNTAREENAKLPFDDNEPADVPAALAATLEKTSSVPKDEPAPDKAQFADYAAAKAPGQEWKPAFSTAMTTPPATDAPPAAASLERSGDISTKIDHTGAATRTGFGSEYQLPQVPMLSVGTVSGGEDLESISMARENLQRTLEDFGIEGQVSGYTTGPRVTRFEITLAPGVNVKKVEGIQDNIAMNLSAQSVRVLAPIPGRPVVGVEISNKTSEAVFMRSVMESEAWRSGKADIPIALGKDVTGKPVVLDLAKAPHLLIAGTTGTGKSVCSNSLIMSLLFHFKPDELKLIMVDPKVVEFEDYRKLPHLLTPVINESAKVPIALRWAVNEMEKRYRILARAGVKKISEYNSRHLSGEPVLGEDGIPIPDRLPMLVVIIDELCDLMMTEARKDVENSITRIAQKGRAAGVHIVVATQRPSTNVITGVIKANLPTRLCFQVRSQIDSRVVLDTGGAEKLLGKGDMLYMSPTSMNIERVQGAFVPDGDIKKVVEFVSSQMPQHFNGQVLAESAEEEEADADAELPVDPEDRADIAPLVNKYIQPNDSPNIRKALEIVILDRKVSTSYLQRRLGIGYNSAAAVIDTLEQRGVVGPASGSGNKREILIFDGMEVSDIN